jgi:hypothetical protein
MRANQALRFDSKIAAEKVAAGLSSNSAAKEYLAVRCSSHPQLLAIREVLPN